MRTVLQGASVFDGRSTATAVADVAIEGERIVGVGPRLDGDRAVDLTGCWLTPGLIDSHVHLMVRSFDLLDIIQTPFSLPFYRAANHMVQTLAAGVTAVRDAGGADLGLKVAQREGIVLGPRLQISVNLMSMTGGHADHWSSCGYATPDFVAHPGRPDGVCDGPADVLRKTREMIRAGADFIKVCATGGLLSPGDDPHQSQFLPEELDLVVRQARASGIRVAAHAQGAEGIKNAVRAGVGSIEHGWYLDDEAIELMLESGTFLVPTLVAPSHVMELVDGRRTSEIEQAREVMTVHRESIGKAVAAGVRIAMGTDSGTAGHGRNLEELICLTDVGMTPSQVMRAATHTSAENLGMDEMVGAIEVGKLADFSVFEIDPLGDLAHAATPDAVKEVWLAGRRFPASQLRNGHTFGGEPA